MDNLVIELIKINSIELVDKGKPPNIWKEYAVKVENYEKGTHYSIPLKKKDREDTAAYKTFKAKRTEWEEKFISNETVEIGVACSIKTKDWTHEGNTGTSTYKTIKFFKDADETRNELSKNLPRPASVNVDDDPIPIDDIPF